MMHEDGEMRRNDNFALFIISDVPYLLPFGQGIADFRRGVQINDTGIYLWELLSEDRTEDEILSLYAAHYEVPASRQPQLKADLRQFLHTLDNYGILRFDQDSADIPASARCQHVTDGTAFLSATENAGTNNTGGTDIVQRRLSIGGLTLLLCGPAKAFSRNFDAFEIFPDSVSLPVDAMGDSSSHTGQAATGAGGSLHTDQTVTVIEHAPAQRPRNRVLLQNRELVIMENDSHYFFLFPTAPGIYEAHLSKDGTDARYYCHPPYSERFRQDLFHAVRLSFLYFAQLHDMVVLHSASLLYRGKAWLFSGHSGAGKSTHTHLWKELYHVPLINGDLNLLSMENGFPMVHGLPWCGTSGIVDTHSYPLGGILLVNKALRNHAASLEDSRAQLLVAQHLISPSWTEALMRKNLRIVAELAPHILICRLHCTKSPEAVETGKKIIDDYLALPPECLRDPV